MGTIPTFFGRLPGSRPNEGNPLLARCPQDGDLDGNVMDVREFLAQIPLPAVNQWLKSSTGANLYSRRRPALAPTRMISVIIPAHNEEAYLERTLEALSRQNYGWFEVIVVANGCTDRTDAIARGRCQRLIVLSQKGLGVARNLGARMARGEMLLFLDADTLLEPMALRVVRSSFHGSTPAARFKDGLTARAGATG